MTIPVRAHERKAPDKPPMAFHDEIQTRLAAKKARSERKHVLAPVVGTAALHDGAGFLRSNSICAAAMALASACVGIVRER